MGNLLLVDEYAQLPRLREVEQAHEVGRALYAVIALGREIPQCRPQEGAAEAIADDIDLALAGGTCDGVQCGERTLDHVIVEALLRQLGVRVHPGEDEHRVAALHRPADQ